MTPSHDILFIPYFSLNGRFKVNLGHLFLPVMLGQVILCVDMFNCGSDSRVDGQGRVLSRVEPLNAVDSVNEVLAESQELVPVVEVIFVVPSFGCT